MPLSSSLQRPALFVLLLAFTVVWFCSLDYRKLVLPDEGRYAEIPREMYTNNDWVTPRLNDLKYFEKPPMQYWATAIAYSVFGEHQWTARLWPALTGFLGVLLLYFTARTLYGGDIGIAAASILGGMLWYLLNSHVNTLDMGLTFFMEAALAGFLLAQRNEANRRSQRNWMLFAWGAMAGAVLSKGLIGIVLPGAVLTIYSLIERDWALWKRLHLSLGIGTFFIIAAPWFVLCSMRNPEFAHFFFIHEHFERYLLHEHKRDGPWFYFVPILLVGTLPWLPHLFRTTSSMWKKEASVRTDGAKPFHPMRLLVVWTGFIFVFFSASSSKLVSYILPIFPSMALLLAQRLPTLSSRTVARLAMPLGLLVAALMPFIPKIEGYAEADIPVEMFAAYEPWLYASGGIFVVVSAGAVLLARRGHNLAATIALAFGSLLSGMTAANGYDVFSPATSSYHLVRTVIDHYGPLRRDIPFYSVAMYEQTLPFYIKRTVTLVDYTDELQLGLEQEPQKGISSQAEFVRRWQAGSFAYAIMRPSLYYQYLAKGLPMKLLAADSRRAIVSRQ